MSPILLPRFSLSIQILYVRPYEVLIYYILIYEEHKDAKFRGGNLIAYHTYYIHTRTSVRVRIEEVKNEHHPYYHP